MQKELIIEKLSGENFDEFVKLIEIFANFEKLAPPDDKAKLRLREDGLGKNLKYEAYLGKIGDEYISYIIFFMAYSSFSALPTLFLEDIFVLKGYRRLGIGQKMLNFCIEFAKERNCVRVDLTVLNWNTNAMKFYEKNNFKPLNWKIYRLEREHITNYSSD